MDITQQANWLRGFLDSLSYADSISSGQIEVLKTKLDLLITTIEGEDEEADDSWSLYDLPTEKPSKNTWPSSPVADDLPF